MIRQYGVLAYDGSGPEDFRILLITSRDTRRWVIPRGNPIFGLLPADSAAQEAREEAGVIGTVGRDEVGAYRYQKRRKSGVTVPANVHVFPLRVTGQAGDWPERGQRELRWFDREAAAAAVDEPGLKILILGFSPANDGG